MHNFRVFSFKSEKISLNQCTIFNYVADGQKNFLISVCIRFKYSIAHILPRGLGGAEVTYSFGEPDVEG